MFNKGSTTKTQPQFMLWKSMKISISLSPSLPLSLFLSDGFTEAPICPCKCLIYNLYFLNIDLNKKSILTLKLEKRIYWISRYVCFSKVLKHIAWMEVKPPRQNRVWEYGNIWKYIWKYFQQCLCWINTKTSVNSDSTSCYWGS